MTLVSLNCLRVNKSIYTVNMLTFHPLGCDLLQESLRREIVTHRWNIRDTNKGIVSFLNIEFNHQNSVRLKRPLTASGALMLCDVVVCLIRFVLGTSSRISRLVLAAMAATNSPARTCRPVLIHKLRA